MYYIYHIIGKKIGVTTDLKRRVENQQGYSSKDYEVLLVTKDIEEASVAEMELQKHFGYKIDEKLYKNLNMRITFTEQTTTFPVPVSKLSSFLNENKGYKWTTEHGDFEITDSSIEFILGNCFKSQFDDNKCYIYNKSLANSINKNLFPLIRQWAFARGIYEKGDPKTQYVKLQEEAGELAKALLKNDTPEIKDAIGDIVVVLTNLAELVDMRIEDCIESAYNEIKDRKGKMDNGTFKKQ